MKTSLNRLDLRISAMYAIFAGLWIVLSDSLLGLVVSENSPLYVEASIIKGLLFVAVTALGLFVVLRAELRKRDQLERARQHDITERLRTLEELRQAESRFVAVFKRSPIGIGILSLKDGRFVDVNDALIRLSGYEHVELIGHTIGELGVSMSPEERAAIVETISAQGGIQSFEIRGRTKSGDMKDLLGSSSLIELGDEPQIVVMVYDITEQKKLAEQMRYHALLLANVSDAVISTDLDLSIRSWNPAAEDIYGWKAEEVIGKPVSQVIQDEYINTSREEVLHQLQINGMWRGEVTHLRKDGSRILLLASTSYVHDSAGNRIGVVSVNRDMTRIRKAEHELQEAERQRHELEKEKELLQLKERFLSVVSHEFRNPLAVIVSSGELVRNYYDRLSRERHLAHIEGILAQAQYMGSLIDDVLTVHTAHAGKLEFSPRPLDLLTFCQITLERMQVLDSGHHRFVFTHQGELSDVTLDKKLVQHILINLLSNAMKYSAEGTTVQLDVNRQDSSVVLRVSDEGIGIPADSLPRLYTPFYRAANTGDISGTGLGMSIVKESVDRHNGTIALDTEVGRGTTVTVTLPIQR